MEDNSMPFSFPDCDAFLASLESESQFTTQSDLPSDLSFAPYNNNNNNNNNNNVNLNNNTNNNNNSGFVANSRQTISGVNVDDDSFQFNELFPKSEDLGVPSPTNSSNMAYTSTVNPNNFFVNPLENTFEADTFGLNNNNNTHVDNYNQNTTRMNLRYSTSSAATSDGIVSPDSMLSDSNSSFSHLSNHSPLSPPEPSPNYNNDKFGSYSPVTSADFSSSDVKPEPVSPKANWASPPQRTLSNTSTGQKLHLSLAVDPTTAATKGSKITKPKKEKSAHNMIERRYRTNINDKILALRDCVPSLQCLVTGVQPSDLDGLRPANKLNKATVLTKAAEYILHLQRRNTILVKENEQLRQQLYRLGGTVETSESLNSSTTNSPHSESSSPDYSDEFNTPQSAPHRNVVNAYPRASRGPSKMVLGSMAGVMATGLINDMANNGSNTYGMSAIPLPAVLFTAIPGTSLQVLQGLKLGLVFMAVACIVFDVLFAKSDTSNSDDPKKNGLSSAQYQPQWTGSDEATELSVKQLRQGIWQLNSAQLALTNFTRDTGFGRLARLGAQLGKAGARALLGQNRFDGLARVFSPDAEMAKAYQVNLTRAVDAQLCGGDPEASTDRFFYTFLQGLLIPNSTLHYMTMAVHIHVVLHELPYFSWMAHGLASLYWRAAKRSAAAAEASTKDDVNSSGSEVEVESDARLALLNLDYTKVFEPDMVQRLVNLAYCRPVSAHCFTGIDDEGFNSVADDCNIKSPLDALGCWVAAQILYQVLTGVLEGEVDFKQLDVGAAVAPKHTVVKRQIVIAESLFMGQNDPEYISRAMALIHEEIDFDLNTKAKSIVPPKYESLDNVESADSDNENSSNAESESDFGSASDSDTVSISGSVSSMSSLRSLSFPISRDSQIAIHSSIVLGYLAANDATAAIPLLQRLQHACRRTTASPTTGNNRMGLLSFVALWITMAQFSERESNRERDWKLAEGQSEKVVESVNGCLEDVAAAARVWIGGDQSELQGLSLRKRRQLATECVKMGKKFGGFNVSDELFA
ncbi:hypothetical protein NADFUDRAFT_83314 [Nadsonia fulvescens var. elongata DSM 6958]|uniref:BHLH domain-containing protein n=1 Tax=Nadsonia fulvescens var. elongata DSM 6958 TaxID=857566 RepID=A0A1E3PIP4_9ASCO|nr:hypothetical protein NADFUDRAFT_83314 [Nadsonia fulvescens var. elongata DSM 6958]